MEECLNNFEVYNNHSVPPAYNIPSLESDNGLRISKVHEDKNV